MHAITHSHTPDGIETWVWLGLAGLGTNKVVMMRFQAEAEAELVARRLIVVWLCCDGNKLNSWLSTLHSENSGGMQSLSIIIKNLWTLHANIIIFIHSFRHSHPLCRAGWLNCVVKCCKEWLEVGFVGTSTAASTKYVCNKKAFWWLWHL